MFDIDRVRSSRCRLLQNRYEIRKTQNRTFGGEELQLKVYLLRVQLMPIGQNLKWGRHIANLDGLTRWMSEKMLEDVELEQS